MSFELLLLKPELLACRSRKLHTPSPIQSHAIPAVLSGRESHAGAHTAPAKRLRFRLPILSASHRVASVGAHRVPVSGLRRVRWPPSGGKVARDYGKLLQLLTAVFLWRCGHRSPDPCSTNRFVITDRDSRAPVGI